jgi:catechol 2,3-dioxygenase-like lactoylglutathione lyase family enzyme
VPGVSHPAVKPGPEGPVSAISSMNHVAFDVAPEQLEPTRERLVAAGVRCTPVVNHDDSKQGWSRDVHPGVFVRSVYFRDPDDISLEIAAWAKVLDASDVRHAPQGAVAVEA